MSRHITRRGFTIIEVLVTIGILGVVIAITLPAVQNALEASRRMQCKSNLRQIGLALHNYHDTHKSFPSGWVGVNAAGRHEVSGTTGWGWAAMLLPELEQNDLFAQADFNSSVRGPSNEAVRQTRLSIFRCPSDPAPDTWDLQWNPTLSMTMLLPNSKLETFATANYVGNFGAGMLENCGSMIGLGMQCTGEIQGEHSGIFYHNSNVRMAEVLDGASNTMMVGERQSSSDGDPASFAAWAGVDVRGENAFARVLASADHPPNSDDGHFTNFSSPHPGISQFLFVDGHVRPVNDLISMDAYHAMASTGEQVAMASSGVSFHHTLPDHLVTGFNGSGGGGIGSAVPGSGFGTFIPVSDIEPEGTSGLNDRQRTGQDIPGFGTGPGQIPYAMVTGNLANDTDWDYYNVELKAGDIIGVNLVGAFDFAGNPLFPNGLISVLDPLDRELLASPLDVIGDLRTFSFLPDVSPLPGGGNASGVYIIPEDGVYSVVVSNGVGNYDMDLWSFRPELERQPPGAHQVLFLDFDGEILDLTEIFPEFVFDFPNPRPGTTPETADLSSFFSLVPSFLRNWDPVAGDDIPLNGIAVVDEIVATVIRALQDIIATFGNNANFTVEILQNGSPSSPGYTPIDPFGNPNVSRIIVGGTILESAINTVGISESIDPGNFETEETALVLLDTLSDPGGLINGITLDQSIPGPFEAEVFDPGTNTITSFISDLPGFPADFYIGQKVTFISGPNTSLTRIITGFDPDTGLVTVNGAHAPINGAAVADAGNTTLTFANNLPVVPNPFYAGAEITFTGGLNNGETRTIVAYDEATGFVTVDADFTNIPADTDPFTVTFPDLVVPATGDKIFVEPSGDVNGIVLDNGNNTLLSFDNDLALLPNDFYVGGEIAFTSGANDGETRTIKDYNTTTGVITLDLPLLPGLPVLHDTFTLTPPPLEPPYDLYELRTSLIGAAVGNVIAHEVGHFLGNFHVDPFNNVPFLNIMDQFLTEEGFGVGGDGIWSNGPSGFYGDDIFIDFGVDSYTPLEPFIGTEDTLNTTAFALSGGLDLGPMLPLPPGAGLGDGWADVLP